MAKLGPWKVEHSGRLTNELYGEIAPSFAPGQNERKKEEYNICQTIIEQ